MIKTNSLIILALAALISTSFSQATSETAVLKLGYSALADTQQNIRTESNGLTFIYEGIPQVSSSLSYYAMLSLLETDIKLNGANTDVADVTGMGLGIKYNIGYSANLNHKEHLNRGIPYFRLGYERIRIDPNEIIGGPTDTESGVIYGFGYEKSFGRIGVFADFIKHPNTYEDNSLTVGAFIKF